jgi:flotillin
MLIQLLVGGGLVGLGGITLASLYKIVPADYADVVIQNGRMRVFSSHSDYNESSNGKSAYFRVPSWFFIGNMGMQVHRMPLKIIPIDVSNFLAFDKDRARFVCDIVAYVTIKNPIVAAKRFSGSTEELKAQIRVLVQSTTRDATTKKTIREIINNREDIMNQINVPLTKSLESWGLDLKSVELIDFKDPSEPERAGEMPPHVIADISSIIETQIQSEAQQKNAEQNKLARIKVADAEREAKNKEIETQEQIAKREQQKLMLVAEQQKLSREKELEVTKVNTVKTQEIEKERAIVLANQQKMVEEINKMQQKLKGEGQQAYLEAVAKGNASAAREQGLAEAAALEAKQKALDKYTDQTIKALVAKDLVEMQRQIGIESAKALSNSDMRVFIGSDGGNFDMGKAVEAINVSSNATANSVLNRLARPLDLGGTQFGSTVKETIIKKK